MDISHYRSRKEIVIEPPEPKKGDKKGHDGFVVSYDPNAISLEEFDSYLADLTKDTEEAHEGSRSKTILDFLEKVNMEWNLRDGSKPIATDRATLKSLRPGRVVVMAASAIVGALQSDPKDTKSSDAG